MPLLPPALVPKWTARWALLLRAGQSPLEPRLVTVPGGRQTEREPHPHASGQPQREPPARHLDRVWPDAGPAEKSLVAAKDAQRVRGSAANSVKNDGAS